MWAADREGFLYYVMPYIEGETLRAKLNRETQVATAVAKALEKPPADRFASAADFARAWPARRHGSAGPKVASTTASAVAGRRAVRYPPDFSSLLRSG